MTTKTFAGLALGSCLMLNACSSGPNEEELARSIFNAATENPDVALSNRQAECIAHELLALGLSDTTLKGLVEDFNRPNVLDSEAEELSDQVKAAATACIR